MILVTGGTGFLGSELLRQLTERGEKVRAIKRDTSVIPPIIAKNALIEWVEADTLDYFALSEAMEGIQKVYHCAAMVSFNPADYKMMQKVNVEGTSNVVNLCVDHSVEKLIHVSSVASLGNAKKGELITEQDSWEFEEHEGYAYSKYESEMQVWRAIVEGLNAVIINPSVIIGKNAGKLGSGALFDTVRRGMSFYPTGSCGFVDVEDVASAMISLMESDVSEKRFIINSENFSYRDLFTKTALEFGLNPPVKKASPWMLGLAWRGAKLLSLITGKKYGVTKSTERSAFVQQNFSNEQIKNTIGINFKPINQSIAEICSALNTSQA
jgi:dihydroflavonol-4-reductase